MHGHILRCLALQRIEPPLYTKLFANISQRIADAAPDAKLIWVTTTPVPQGIDGYRKRPMARAAAPHAPADPPIYNKAAAKAVSIPASSRIAEFDLARS